MCILISLYYALLGKIHLSIRVIFSWCRKYYYNHTWCTGSSEYLSVEWFTEWMWSREPKLYNQWVGFEFYLYHLLAVCYIAGTFWLVVLVVVQLLSCVWLFAATGQAFLSFTISPSLLTLMSSESMMHLTISSSSTLFSFWFQSFPASGSFQRSQFFMSGAKVLEFQFQHQSFQWIFRTDFL